MKTKLRKSISGLVYMLVIRGSRQELATGGAYARLVGCDDYRELDRSRQKCAREITKKYGQPDGATASQLIWLNNPPRNAILNYFLSGPVSVMLASSGVCCRSTRLSDLGC